MIKKEIDGKIFYCFESSEKEARKEFEKAMVAEDTIKKMTLALIEACSEYTVRKVENWEEIKTHIVTEYPELQPLEGLELEYRWIFQFA